MMIEENDIILFINKDKIETAIVDLVTDNGTFTTKNEIKLTDKKLYNKILNLRGELWLKKNQL